MAFWSIFGSIAGTYPGTGVNGPVSSTSYTGPLVQHIHWSALSSLGKQLYIAGYGYWRADGSQGAAPQFATWQVTGAGSAGTYLGSSSLLTFSGGLTGQWNYALLPTPIAITPRLEYATVYGQANNFSQFLNIFGTGDPDSGGIIPGGTNPLTVFSAPSGTLSDQFSNVQCGFSTATSDPTAQMGATANSDYNALIDVIITDVGPAVPTYRMYPNSPVALGTNVPSTSTAYMPLARQFSISATFAPLGVKLLKLWHYSPPGCASLPTRTGFFNGDTGIEIAALSNLSPSWKDPSGSGASAGDGWIYVDYSASNYVLLPGTNYMACRGNPNNATTWFAVTLNYYSGAGPGTSGEQASPLVYPNSAGSLHGQDVWNVGATWGNPTTATSSETDWGDVEVSAPIQAGGGIPPIQSNAAGDVYGWVWDKGWLKRRQVEV